MRFARKGRSHGYFSRFGFMWGWFMVTVFMLPELTVVPAIGVALVIGYLTKQHQDTSAISTAASISFVFITPLSALFFGWVIQGFM